MADDRHRNRPRPMGETVGDHRPGVLGHENSQSVGPTSVLPDPLFKGSGAIPLGSFDIGAQIFEHAESSRIPGRADKSNRDASGQPNNNSYVAHFQGSRGIVALDMKKIAVLSELLSNLPAGGNKSP